jgi:acetyl/propionyl-CoA carboxylase alpha subunit
VGAGTVEFIFDSSGEFYFLEMNTRLQVEHPVTEMVTGLDLVQMQIEVAQGEKLRISQADVKQHGHAIEVRLYAEDAARDFMPSPGTLSRFDLPHLPHVRCENGYASGNTVSASYDPMIAKIAAWGNARAEATERLLNALSQTQVSGVTNNRAFLMKVLAQPAFAKGDTSTDFITKHKEVLLQTAPSDADVAPLAAAYFLTDAKQASAGSVLEVEHSAWVSPKLAGVR